MRFPLHALLLTTMFLLGSAAVASAQWTAVASTGAVDDLDLAIFDTANSVIQIKSSAALPAGDSFPARNGFQSQQSHTCGSNPVYFPNNAYYIDVAITKSATGGTPALQGLQVRGLLVDDC